ncbi:MAG: trigger factor, partial [Desulfobulbia bacterium]
MHVTETQSEGFKRELKVIIEAKEIEDKVAARLEQLKGQINLKGFRPGKVPVAHIRKLYGKSVAAEIVQQTVAESSQKALNERELKPAHEPEVGLTEDKDEIEKIISGQADLAYTLSFEILPDFEVVDLSNIELDRYVSDVSDDAVDKGAERLLENGITYQSKDGPAETGDRVTIDFVGTMDGEEFEGGRAEDAPVVLGQNSFIPGFEDGLIGAVKDEDRKINLSFPEDYPVEKLSSKPAEFEVKIKEVAFPIKPELNEEFAKNMGLDSVDALRDAIRERMKQEYEGATKARLKRQLLDKLD